MDSILHRLQEGIQSVLGQTVCLVHQVDTPLPAEGVVVQRFDDGTDVVLAAVGRGIELREAFG